MHEFLKLPILELPYAKQLLSARVSPAGHGQDLCSRCLVTHIWLVAVPPASAKWILLVLKSRYFKKTSRTFSDNPFGHFHFMTRSRHSYPSIHPSACPSVHPSVHATRPTTCPFTNIILTPILCQSCAKIIWKNSQEILWRRYRLFSL